MLNLDAARAARTAERGPEPLMFGGTIICELPPELPVDVLEPLTAINVDVALIFRTAIDAFKSQDEDRATMSVLDGLVDVLVINKDLPDEVMAAVREMGRRLLGDAGYEAFLAARPSVMDVAELVKGLLGLYRLRLGESLSSSVTSSGGTTSTPTSPAVIPGVISEASGDAPESPASSELAVS
ncbi:hypothetical protein [Streptosporangium sp. NPDC002524]|uniref:hypothetical protein n=1 Tax=Streptosporangium sp. NPDC002524 TaxID=3154537 RepID=UPI00331E4D07